MNSANKSCATCSAFHPVRRCWASVNFSSQPDPEAVCQHHQGLAQSDSDPQVSHSAEVAATLKPALLLKPQWWQGRAGGHSKS